MRPEATFTSPKRLTARLGTVGRRWNRGCICSWRPWSWPSVSPCCWSADVGPSPRSTRRPRRPRHPHRRRPSPVVAAPPSSSRRWPSREAVAPPASLRDRMRRARSALTGAFTGIIGRGAITDETWDDLEEALLRADVGIGVTTGLLDGLRAQVKSKEITNRPHCSMRSGPRCGPGWPGRSHLVFEPNDDAPTSIRPTSGCSSASTASARPPPSARSPNSSRPKVAPC